MNRMLESLLERASRWPEAAQAELVETMVEIEARYAGPYRPSAEERAAIERGLRELRDGDLATDDDVAALFRRYRPA